MWYNPVNSARLPIPAGTGMPISIKQLVVLLGVFALVFASVPADACDGTTDEPADCTDHPCDPCGTPNEPSDGCGQDEDDGCCPEECPNCYHACCIGLVALPALAGSSTAELATRSALVSDHGKSMTAHRRSVYHPPNR